MKINKLVLLGALAFSANAYSNDCGSDSMSLRGSFNQWAAKSMTCSDGVWLADVQLTANSELKFDRFGDWSENYGDSGQMGALNSIGELGAANIQINEAGIYSVAFDFTTKEYTLLSCGSQRIYLRPVSMVGGERPSSMTCKAGEFTYKQDFTEHAHGFWLINTADRSSSNPMIWGDDNDDGIAELNAAVIEVFNSALDQAVQTNEITFNANTMEYKVASDAAGIGQVRVAVYGDRVENGQIVSSPISSVGVYHNDWHAGEILAYTDQSGQASFDLASGLQTLSVFKMTSSHSALAAYNYQLDVVADASTTTEIHLAPTTVNISVTHDAGMGNALYITGQTDYLGNWATATRLTYMAYNNTWSIHSNLPIGAEFKIVKAPWGEATTISTAGVLWQSGGNVSIPAPYQSYEAIVELSPSF